MSPLTACPLGHEENLSHREMAERLDDEDFECRDDGCSKKVSYPIDEVFWDRYVRSPKREPFVYMR